MSGVTPSDIYEAEKSQKAPSTDNLEIEGPKVTEGCVVKLEIFIGKDDTTPAKTIRLGKKKGSDTIWLKEAAAATGDHQIAQDGFLILVGGESPLIMVESPTSADVCRIYARGVYL
jgi:hypothetical protein